MSRILIEGTLTTRSPFSIGNGLSHADRMANEDKQLSKHPLRPSEHNLHNTRLIVRDAKGLPYIPASAIKAALSRAAEQLYGTDDILVQTAFGTAPEESADGGQGGAVRFCNARIDNSWLLDFEQSGKSFAQAENLPWWSPDHLTFIEPTVAIHRITGTSQRHRLGFREAVPPTVRFRVALWLHHADPDHGICRMLLRSLEQFNDDVAPVSIGSETANGWGILAWKPTAANGHQTEVTCYSLELQANPFECREQVKIQPLEPAEAPASSRTADQVTVCIHLQLECQGPFLVRDPSQTNRPVTLDGQTTNVDHYARRSAAGHALLPASGFRGVFRSHLERIIQTLNPHAAASPDRMPAWEEPVSDEEANEATTDALSSNAALKLLHQLLGSTQQRSAMQLTDFVQGDAAAGPVVMEMLATDRLTGGISGSRKFNALAFDSPVLNGTLRLLLPNDESGMAAAGLVILGLKDLIDGRLAFGASVYRGFGACTARITKVQCPAFGATSDKAEALSTADGSNPSIPSHAFSDLLSELNSEQVSRIIDILDGNSASEPNNNDHDELLARGNACINRLLETARSYIAAIPAGEPAACAASD